MHIVPLLVVAAVQQAPPPARVEVRPATVEIAVGATRTLEAIAYDAESQPMSGGGLTWLSSDPAIVTVDSTGTVTAIRPGEARVTALIRRVPGVVLVTVPQLPPSRITLRSSAALVLAGTSMPLEVRVATRLGDELRMTGVRFTSSDAAVASVDDAGRVYGHRAGTATITASAGSAAARITVRVSANPAADYAIEPLRTTVRTGDVVRFRASARSAAGAEVGRLFPAWSVGASGAQIEDEGTDGVFVADAPGTYRVTALIGPAIARSAVVTVVPRRTDARLITVGRGPSATHHSGDMWAFEGVDGRDYAYIGTFMHDWMKAWDVTDPSRPVLTDSVQVDARRINDVKIHPNNRLAVITREGASDRRNGIVILDLTTPAHPTLLSEFTDSVTGGVHNVWIRGDENLVYACHNGTSDLIIIDISDPARPRHAGRWGLDKRFKSLHDVIVQNGYAYLSYWDDGLVMLDVGAGTHGGTPTRPALVSQFAYPVGNTHTAWRAGRYLFVGDEIFPDDWDAERPIEARGYVHVLDYSDPERPREVARYEVPEAGAHNFWVDGDRLYVGYYQAGLRVVDIAGELRGDLYRQGREIAVLKTTDAQTTVPNWPMTWGAQVFKGNIYTADLNSGLWIARLVEQRPVP